MQQHQQQQLQEQPSPSSTSSSSASSPASASSGDDEYDYENDAVAATPAATATPTPQLCLKCHVRAIEFMTATCHHACFCRTCAMKCASGGRCKLCNEFYDTLTHVR